MINISSPKYPNMYALVDDEDFPILSNHKWYAYEKRNTFYAARTTRVLEDGRKGRITMHRAIMGAEKGLEVDHINGDGLDNRRANLRICTRRENGKNIRKKPNTSSMYKGVHWHKAKGRMQATIRVDGKRIHLGYFESETAAAKAYNDAATKFHGEFAKLNVIEQEKS